jgi:hypothetical protein
MQRIEAANAFYVKLGTAGSWAENAIAQNKFRVGWKWIDLSDINERRWSAVRRQVKSQLRGKPKGVVTSDFNALKRVIESTSADLWITFHNNSLWWTTLKDGPVRRDSLSTYRLTATPWTNCSISGRELTVSNIPGSISQLQGYRATICSVSRLDVLLRTINGEESPAANSLREKQRGLVESVSQTIQNLHWKDFETLVDLIFRASGWRRTSVLGQHTKGLDLELIEPIMKDRYVVQIKSRAGLPDLEKTLSQFRQSAHRVVFFIVHSPEESLLHFRLRHNKRLRLIVAEDLAQMTVDAGLLSWIAEKAG